MESISELLSLAEDLLLIGKPIAESNVLKAILMDLLIFGSISVFPLLHHLRCELLAVATKDGILSD